LQVAAIINGKVEILTGWPHAKERSDDGSALKTTSTLNEVVFGEGANFYIGYSKEGKGVKGLKDWLNNEDIDSRPGRKLRELCENWISLEKIYSENAFERRRR
jgi:hypothetical protein